MISLVQLTIVVVVVVVVVTVVVVVALDFPMRGPTNPNGNDLIIEIIKIIIIQIRGRG